MPDMRSLMDAVAQAEDFWLWYGTSETAETIMRDGLKPGRHGAVFLTDNPQLAVEYAETDQERTGTDEITVVKVKVRDLDPSKLTGDIDHTTTDDWQESLIETDQCMYLGPIPAHLLTLEDVD